jgi:hypothetical protein
VNARFCRCADVPDTFAGGPKQDRSQRQPLSNCSSTPGWQFTRPGTEVITAAREARAGSAVAEAEQLRPKAAEPTVEPPELGR